MRTWQIHYTLELNDRTRRDYTFSLTQRFPPSKIVARQHARNLVEPILDSRRAMSDLTVNWIRRVAA